MPQSPNTEFVSSIQEAFQPVRDALRPRGASKVTMLRLQSGCAVNADVPQRAIDEIIKYHLVGAPMGEPLSACMQLAKILLADSAYMDFTEKPSVIREVAEPQYVIRFDNGGYNQGEGERNGFDVDFADATRYTKEEVLDKAKNLCGIGLVLEVEVKGQPPGKESDARINHVLTAAVLVL